MTTIFSDDPERTVRMLKEMMERAEKRREQEASALRRAVFGLETRIIREFEQE